MIIVSAEALDFSSALSTRLLP